MGRVFQRKRDKGRPGHGSKLAGWYAAWTDEKGRRLQRRAGDTQREAKEFLADEEAEVRRRRKRPGWQADSDGAIGFSVFIEEYMGRVKAHLRDPAPRRRHLEAWGDHFGRTAALRDIGPVAVEGFLAKLRHSGHKPGDSGRSPATCNRYLASLRHALNKAVEWRQLPASPIQGVKPFKEMNERTRVISTDEERRLLAAAGESHCPALRPLIIIALETCARPDELLNLRWPEVDLERELVTFARTKDGSTRQVHLTDRAVAALEQLGTRFAGEWVFVHGGEHWTNPRRAFEHACKAAGIPYGRDVEGGLVFRDTRRTAITRLAEMGFSASVIQRWSGHRTLAMVQRYTAISDEAVRAVADALNRRRSHIASTKTPEDTQ